MDSSKKILREEYRGIRLSVASDVIDDDSLRICRRVFHSVDWSNIEKICAYTAIPDLKEVDVNPLLEAIKYKYPDKKITVLKQSKKQSIPKTKYDLILVPCLAFDKDNFRLGWGGGFYDKFLAAQPRAYKVGLCFQNGYVQSGLPRETHDIPLDLVITEK